MSKKKVKKMMGMWGRGRRDGGREGWEVTVSPSGSQSACRHYLFDVSNVSENEVMHCAVRGFVEGEILCVC